MRYLLIEILLGAVATIVITVLGFYVAKLRGLLKKQATEQSAICKGVKALLRDRILQSYNYYLGKGYIPIYARDNVQSLLDEYKALGGNGVVDGLVKKLALLPTETPSNSEDKGVNI